MYSPEELTETLQIAGENVVILQCKAKTCRPCMVSFAVEAANWSYMCRGKYPWKHKPSDCSFFGKTEKWSSIMSL